ncbi:PilZ domain-containing protein [Sphingomonas sp. BN140010]|uniref:PilZ domain-containing protein n=1 Tax=Sphingomonas arvum TaxID=2992113 RepID=A0ABT3JI41_9SPHN|nr:PilZ domain-containing protein [Sphingomonas sp. BN140010]MCW3798752.1 PilZ domain-containing protein [Sphingomonas sp. BN140010]
MNDFRSRVLGGTTPANAGLLKAKTPRQPTTPQCGEESLERVAVPRAASRIANHRFADRHRLGSEAPVTARHGRGKYQVKLVNLSGGGAMIDGAFKPELWDRVDLDLAGSDRSGRVECAVRWIRGSRMGLEFAHETRIEADDDTRAALLREVLSRSFADVVEDTIAQAESTVEALEAELTSAPQSRRREPRHPLIWSGEVLFQHDRHPVRLRNISSTGALVESGTSFPVGAELYLDIDQAEALFAVVSWAHGDQYGLAFRQPFNLSRLAAVKPQVAPSRWAKPDYLRDEGSDNSPWAAEWGRLTLKELNKTLRR